MTKTTTHKTHNTSNVLGNSANNQLKVGIIGGGVAGSTIAVRLAALGVQTYLLETKASLIDGPPMCHLHAGGNLYREIPDEDGVELLKQSIDILRMYPHSIDVRPTVIAVPKRDAGKPEDLLPRLMLLTKVYREMVIADPANKVLGEPEDYFHLYQREDLERLTTIESSLNAQSPQETDEWVAAAAKQLDLDKLKFPIVAVKEYGWNIFRLAASAEIALSYHPNAQVMLNKKVIDVYQTTNATGGKKWQINFVNNVNYNESQPLTESIQVDYLINACGFRTGFIDNMIGIPAQRMVEFKASYVTHWETMTQSSGVDTKSSRSPKLPEIIIHGNRGTPHGMVQLTPYPEGYYQIHSMNKTVTLFDDGLVATTGHNAQPELKPKYLNYIESGWNPDILYERSQKAIEQVSEFVPRFASAKPTRNALYGGQQIPGTNDTLRVADITLYPERHYARAENVKASSALLAADDVVAELENQNLLTEDIDQKQARQNHRWLYLQHTTKHDIDTIACDLAQKRAFPLPMAGVVTPYQPY